MAVASLVTAAMLTSAIGSIVGGGIQAGATVAGGAATTAIAATGGAAAAAGSGMSTDAGEGPVNYFIDSLFRSDGSASVPANGASGSEQGSTETPSASSAEAARIFMNTIRTGALPAEDLRYVGQIVSQRTGLTQQDAEKRVQETYSRLQEKLRAAETAAREAVDKGRKASAYAALWLFVSLLSGAFVASLAATYGGRRREA